MKHFKDLNGIKENKDYSVFVINDALKFLKMLWV